MSEAYLDLKEKDNAFCSKDKTIVQNKTKSLNAHYKQLRHVPVNVFEKKRIMSKKNEENIKLK